MATGSRDDAPLAPEASDQPPGDDGAKPSKRRFNESAHKLEYWPARQVPAAEDDGAAPTSPVADHDRDVVAHAGRAVLALGALGVVYGDIGTSPLYTEQTIFTQYHATAQVTAASVFGIVSLIFWALMVIVSIKYAGFIMRAHNRGDGGIMALTALVMRKRVLHTAALVLLGIFGAALFFGDGMITPAISVLGALGGLQVDAPALGHLIVPLSLVILIGLFLLQQRGTGAIGWLFGPVMVRLVRRDRGARPARGAQGPGVLSKRCCRAMASALWSTTARPAFLTLGGVVLAVTGAEALYADRGHFGAGPIRVGLVRARLPGPGAQLPGPGRPDPRTTRSTKVNPFFLMVPSWGRFALLLLATAATIIASQAVITGSFSVAKQAMQLGFLPRLKIRHTSKQEGQIYVPIINWVLVRGVVALVLLFRSASSLGNIYGVAVTGTFILNTTAVPGRRPSRCGARPGGSWSCSARCSSPSRSRSSAPTWPSSAMAPGCRSRSGS